MRQKTIQQAQNENTNPDILTRLATNKSKSVRQCVAGNPNTPVQVLEQLSQEFPEEIIANPIFELLLLENPQNTLIRLAIAQSPKTSAATLDKLAVRVNDKAFPARIFIAIAKHPNVTAEILDKLIQAGNCLPVHLAVLQNPKVSIATLEKLANHRDASGKDPVFKHSKIDRQFLDKLSLSPHINVRKAVAEHSKTDNSTIYLLAKDSSEIVRKTIAKRQNITPEIIEILAGDAAKDVRYQIASCERLPETIISHLAQDSSEDVRYQIACHQNANQGIISHLAQDNSENIRRRIACRQDLTKDIFSLLKSDSSAKVRYQIAKNRDTAVNIVHMLALDGCEEVRCAVARRQNLTEATANILTQDSSEKVRYQIAHNQNISENTANRLARDSSEYVRRQLVNHLYRNRSAKYRSSTPRINQNVSSRTLEILLKKSEENNYPKLPRNIDLSSPGLKSKKEYSLATIYDLETRKDIARHPKVTFEILERLKSDRYDCIRQAVASNKNNLYPEIIRELANDSAVIVRAAIAKNIKSHDFTLAALPSEQNNINTFEGILFQLAKDEDLAVRQAVASNLYTLKSILERLAKDEATIVRQAVAINPNTPEKILEGLIKNNDATIVRLAIAKNPNTSIDTLKKLSVAMDKHIASEAKLNLEAKQTAIQQANHENILPTVSIELAKSKYKIIRQYIASNANTPISTLEILSKEFPEEVTANPVFSLLMLENPMNPLVQLSLARSANTSEKTLLKIYQNHCSFQQPESMKILVAIANNKKASSELRKQLKFEIRAMLGVGLESNYTL